MFDEKDLRELAGFQAEHGAVLSLYLSTDPSRHLKEEAKLTLRGMLKQASALGALPADVERVEQFIELEHDWQSKGVAMFSSQANNFWRAIPVSVPVQNHVFVADRPYVKPLSDILNEHGRYAVVLVSQEAARLVMFRLGVVEDAAGIIGEELKHHKQGGWAAERLQRYEKGKAHQNLKSVVKLAQDFCAQYNCSRLVVGGTDETVAKFVGMLPKAAKDKVVGTISIDIAAPETEILDRSQEAIEEAQRAQESEWVKQAITAAAKGGPGAIGLDDTLAALQEGRVHKLLVGEGFHGSAYRCESCGYIAGQETEACIYCGGGMATLVDAADAIVRRAIEQGVDVEFVPDDEDLEAAGALAAILRY
jgi:peptide chain release factor subunit 1